MYIKVNEKEISERQINEWRLTRIPKALRTIKRTLPRTRNTTDMMNKLTDIKLTFSYDDMYGILKGKLNISTAVMKMAVKMSRKTKFARTEIYIDGISTADVSPLLDALMLESSPEHNHVNLTACPEHYVLKPTGSASLGVIETCGNAPLPFQFFITFGDESAVKTALDISFEYQSVGTARLKDRTPIGGVRHQFKDVDNGVLAKLCVEFPSLTPNTIIRAHQMHLASEFSYWLQWIKMRRG